MGAQAVALARAVDYDSAGTVEFVAGQDRSFFFLEMNTRLQVEHPVTELVTGLDLVEQMIRVAAGEELAIRQEDVRMEGWAVEARVYAEDPTRGFLPSTGRLTTYRPPVTGEADGTTVRVDTGVGEGGAISIFYDPMIAKLVTHAPTRDEAIAAQSHALDSFAIHGIRHNIPFLSALMGHERWRAGRLSTGFIAEEFGAEFAEPRAEPAPSALRLACVAAVVDAKLQRPQADDLRADAGGAARGVRAAAHGADRGARHRVQARRHAARRHTARRGGLGTGSWTSRAARASRWRARGGRASPCGTAPSAGRGSRSACCRCPTACC